VDQLNLEKRGIPTVTVVTTAFEELFKSMMKYQVVSEMAQVVVEHPIAGRNQKETSKLVDAAFPQVIKAATKWQPPQK
jgi:hypothetical protein